MPRDSIFTERPARTSRPSLGARVRQLRVNRGLTQTELAGERFSKEYVSQIERGKTRPTADTIAWMAARLGVDVSFLETGVASDTRERAAGLVSRAEAALEARRYEEAATILSSLDEAEVDTVPELALRALLASGTARMQLGHVREAVGILSRARALAEDERFTDVDRAEVLYRLALCRVKLSSFATASALLDEALTLAERCELPCDRLRSAIHQWRARCREHQRDWEAAREDIERALELAQGLDDREAIAHVYFQASVVAERQGRWVAARSYAELAKTIYEELSDRARLGKMLNNLGGLNFLLGKPDDAVEYLKEAFRVALETGDEMDAGFAVSSLAQVHLRTGSAELAEEQARHALRLLGDDEHVIEEIGNAQLVLGRSLLAQDRLDEAEQAFRVAETSFARLSSASHRAAAWMARGDLAAHRGDVADAAKLYRSAAEALQDFRF